VATRAPIHWLTTESPTTATTNFGEVATPNVHGCVVELCCDTWQSGESHGGRSSGASSSDGV
jgi:hypothetical protein